MFAPKLRKHKSKKRYQFWGFVERRRRYDRWWQIKVRS